MIIEALERDLPPATLLLGPDLHQMVNAAKWSTNGSGLIQADRLIARHVSAADARGIVRFAQTAPFGPFKLVIAVLDGSTPQAQNILLKVLEEPPPTIRFILVATERPLPTIVSRCRVIIVPAADGGQEPDGKVAAQVSAALKAALAADLAGLDQALKGWGDVQHAVLQSRLTETALSGDDADERWRSRRLLGALGRFAGAHPRLAAHAALVSVLSDREQHA
jgi:hypothetical protein